MADESHYSSETTTTTNKRKYDDQIPPPSTRTRPTGFSSGPIPSASPDSGLPPPAYNTVPPPSAADDFALAKQRAQELASRLMGSATAAAAAAAAAAGSLDAKRPKFENGSGALELDKGFSSGPPDMKPHSAASAIPFSYHGGGGFQGPSKRIDIPNNRVGVIIGKGGETIKFLQVQSGSKIQVTRDNEADLNSPNRTVELMGTPEQIAKAEQLINEVLSEADAGGSGIVSRRVSGQSGSDNYVTKIPNNKVGLVIGKGGETIKNIQSRSGARVQVIPLHLPPGDTSQERTLQIDGTTEQIEVARQLVDEVISENRIRNPAMAGGYSQQGYQVRPPTSWGPPGAPQVQQHGYGFVQPGSYPGPSPQYNMSQPHYAGYPPQPTSGGYAPQPTSGGYASGWDQSTAPPTQQTSQGSGYDYYGQPSSQQQTPGGPAASADNSGYNYTHPPASSYQQVQGYTQDGYGGYHAPPQSGYGQAPPYDQLQGYNSAPGFGAATNPPQEGSTPSYGTQGETAQAPTPVQPSAVSQQGYATGQQPSPNPGTYPQGTTQPGYGMPPTSQTGYQPPVQSGYGLGGYGAPPAQKPPANPPAYGQAQQSPSTPGGYGQPAVQPGYLQSQPPASGYAQSDTGTQRVPPSSYGASAGQPGYGPPPYGAPPASQSGYGQPPYYSQPPVYAADGNPNGSTRGTYDAAPASQAAQQSVVAKASPPS
ncbi:KH_1 domain-containing protein [Cephalotus follicularis]|uniref:KH_1 domain-containing protein n=1 Tax=Cephalotus follicularis TaxID=3775 RepID=A0A1Q3AMK1_CEPFO|nr:KH_1 domain-containing protein [Cephalotus follicularis]